MKRHIDELRRRGVFQTLAGYAVGSWFLIELTSVLGPAFLLPSWAVAAVMTLLVLGALPVLFVSWRYDLTSKGFVRDTRTVGDEIDWFARRVSIVIAIALAGATTALWLNYFRALDAGEFETMYRAQRGAPAIPDDGLIRSIAVLPFQDFSPGSGRQLLADGIPEAILHALAQQRELLVTARTSSFFFRDKDVTAAEIGSILGVEALLEGSVQVAGDRLRVTSQLVRTADQGHIWSNVYEARLDDVFAIQDTIANTVRDLVLTKSGGGVQTTAKQKPPSLEAYQLLIEARNLLYEKKLDATDRAISLLRLATELEPQYADAFTWLSVAIDQKVIILTESRGESWWSVSDLFKESSDAVDRALELNPDDPVAILEKGFHEQGEAFHEAKLRAIELAPNDPRALSHIALLSFQTMEFAVGREYLQRARRVDPADYEALGEYILHFCGREELTPMIETQLRNYPTTIELSLSMRYRANFCDGRHVDAMSALSRLVRISEEPENPVLMLLDLARMGHRDALLHIDTAHRLVPGMFSHITMDSVSQDTSIYHPDVAETRLATFRWAAQGPANPWFFLIPHAELFIQLDRLDSAMAVVKRIQSMWERFYDYLDDRQFSTETTRIYALKAWLLRQDGDEASAAELAGELLSALQATGLTQWAEVRDNLQDTPLLVLLLNDRTDEALAWLRGAEADGWPGFQPLLSSPLYQDLRRMPEARDILERMQANTRRGLDEILAAGISEASDPELLTDRIQALYPPTELRLATIAAYADRDYQAAADHFEAALGRTDADVQLLWEAADFARLIGHNETAVSLEAAAVGRRPEDSYSYFRLGYANFLSRRWDPAITAFEKALSLNPDANYVHRWIGITLIMKGEPEAAMRSMEKVDEGPHRLLALAMGHYASGALAESDRELNELERDHGASWAYNIAYAHAMRNEPDMAFEWLGEAMAGTITGISNISSHPMFDNIRDDSRWSELLTKLGVAPGQVANIEFEIPPLPEI